MAALPVIPLWLLPAAFAFRGWRPRRELAFLSLVVLFSTFVQVPGILVSGLQVTAIQDAFFSPAKQAYAHLEYDYGIGLRLLKHKVIASNEVYRPEEFNTPELGN